MPIVIDKLLAKPLLHSHTEFPSTSGFTMTGDLNFPNTGFVMKDANNVRWRVTIGTDGALTTTAITEGAIGSPWLFLFGNI